VERRVLLLQQSLPAACCHQPGPQAAHLHACPCGPLAAAAAAAQQERRHLILRQLPLPLLLLLPLLVAALLPVAAAL
jgi:hypothetical protein